MKRQCNCSGACGPQIQGVTRREFIALVGAGTAGALLSVPASAASQEFQMPVDELERWKRSLNEAAPARIYRSDAHTDARMHLGGIGTGNFEIGADGQFTTWQLFNTLRDGQVPFYFAVKAGAAAKLLQTSGGPDWPRIAQIEMIGEYPMAVLRFLDSDLPVKVQLTAFSPFAPLDAALSSVPAALFVFRIQNPTGQSQTVSLAVLMQNPVGYEAMGQIDGITHPNYGQNINECYSEGGASVLAMRADSGPESSLDKPVAIYVTPNLRGVKTLPAERPANLTVELLDQPAFSADKLSDPRHTVIWMEEAQSDLAESLLRAARDAAAAGATLLFSGKTMPLLESYAHATGGKPLAPAQNRPDILFEDFEHGYGKWTVEGEAFGRKPSAGTLPNQQSVSGFAGHGLVNSFLGGDDPMGRLISHPFTIERRFIRFLVGGGEYANTQIRLVIEGKAVRRASGHNSECLQPAAWDVSEFEGKEALLEIVDEQKRGWGHINVDQIEFSDQPANTAVLELLEELLPVRFGNLRPASDKGADRSVVLKFDGLELKANTQPAKARNGLPLWMRPFGKGQVVLAAGPILDPSQAALSGARQRAFAVVFELVGTHYRAPDGPSAKAPGFGTLALATWGAKATAQTAFADWNEAWKDFSAKGQFASLDPAKPNTPTPAGQTVNGALAATVEVAPGATVEVPFAFTWHYPNKYNGAGVWMGCHYATRWPDARAVMRETVASFPVWRERTERFRATVYDSTLPYWLLDCLTSQASIIRHIGVIFRIANGDVYGWEGSNGCCQPTCTHVWGYEQSFSRLFPDLEKEMRRIDFFHQQRADGGINNRTDVPSPPHPTGEQPFADGHASCILKAYREALNHPDDRWLKQYWPQVKRAVDYLIGRDAATSGGQPSGILRDDQWNTYDEALHGVTTFIGTYYLAALRAGEEWARRMGDIETADRFHAVFEKGQKQLVDRCWNGEYFQQNLPDYAKRSGEVGPGCMSDQLIGQWWAHQLGLGYLLPKDKIQSALRAIFKYNWKSDLTGWKHSPRAFAGNRDKGLIICTWPKGGRPGSVMLYSDEVWTGIEYQVAAHMIYEGMWEEGFAIVKGARERYDGAPRAPMPRDPWNEIECGGHYARAMSSWSLLLALSGFEYDGPAQALRFAPRITPDHFRAFFSGPEGWGSLAQNTDAASPPNGTARQRVEVAVKWGRLRLRRLSIAVAENLRPEKTTVIVAGQIVPATPAFDRGWVEFKFSTEWVVKEGEKVEVVIS